MEREEPRLGTHDLAEVEFRRGGLRATRLEQPTAGAQLWWQIALGVFIGLLGHSIAIGLYARWEMSRALKQLDATMDAGPARLERQAAVAARAATHPRDDRPWPVSMRAPSPPLRVGERCIKGERFKRLDNGWQHLPRQPCE